MKHTFTGKVDEFDLTIKVDGMRYNKSILENFVGKELSITIDEKKKPRSVAQNAWYWGVAIPTIVAAIKEYEGVDYTKEEIHQYVKQVLLTQISHKVKILGDIVEITRDLESTQTSTMSISRFNEFKEELQHYFSKRDIIIPDPLQEDMIDYNARGGYNSPM